MKKKMNSRILVRVIICFLIMFISGCTGPGRYYYPPPVYDGYIASLQPKTLPEIKDNNEIKIP